MPDPTKLSDIDWSQVPLIENASKFMMYMRASAGSEYIPLRCKSGFAPDLSVAISNIGATSWLIHSVPSNGKENEQRTVYQMTYRHGARIVHAAKRRDLTFLDRDERAAYKAAMPIVEKALRQPTLLRRELFIHDAIIKTADYDYECLKLLDKDPTIQTPSATAYGVLINKKAICSGFSDAFYLLGNLAGLNVGYWTGTTGGEPKGPHAWNIITIGGITYFVDTTFDHRGYVTKNLKRHDYVYFNAPREIISSSHSWNKASEAGLRIAEKVDANFFYTASEYNAAEELFGYYYSSVQQGFHAIAKHILMGNRRVAGFMMTYDPKYENSSAYFPEIRRHIDMIVQNSAYRKRPYYEISLETNPKCNYMLFTVYL